jgi:predicted glutamine amidotransferase
MDDREGTLIVSEPLDDVRDTWRSIPAQHLITITSTSVTATPLAVSAQSAPA